ncbi:MAG: hypothetical protein ACE5KT_10755 [Methanosarcinales archaeon]
MDNGLYRSSVTRGYYAVYQAMWSVLGDPPKKRWKHIGILKNFTNNYYSNISTKYEELIDAKRLFKDLVRLYEYRLLADYDASDIAYEEAKWAYDLSEILITIISKEFKNE